MDLRYLLLQSAKQGRQTETEIETFQGPVLGYKNTPASAVT